MAPEPTTTARRAALWAALVAVHAWTGFVGVGVLRTQSFFDVELYRVWVLQGLLHGSWPVLDTDWVYPAGALAPMLAVAPWAGSAAGYALAWTVLVTLLDAGAAAVLLRTSRHGEAAVWWWLAAILALGPVGIGRLEGVAVPVTVTALALLARHPRTAAALLTLAAWVKVAPGAVLLAVATASRRVWRDVALPAAAVSAAVVGVALLGGSGDRVAGFLTTQTVRGLQVEAVAGTPFSLARAATESVRVELDRELNTYHLVGGATTAVARVLDVALPLGVLAVAWLVRRAARIARTLGRPVDDPAAPVPLGALALTLVLVVLNKVGSPQYVAWLVPPVVAALATSGWSVRWRPAALGVLLAAALTQWLFPHGYPAFLQGDGLLLVVAAARNLLLVVLLGWAVRELWLLGTTGGDAPAERPGVERRDQRGPLLA